jgi:hypothetical protein
MDVFTTILTAIITSGLVTAVLNWYIKSKELGEQRRWEIKREACLEALEIIDARFADYEWLSDGAPVKIDKQDYIPTAKIRSCFNRLVLSCRDSSVPQEFERCLNLDMGKKDSAQFSMDSVVKLRNAIRKELGFGKELSTDLIWIKYINWSRMRKQ